MHTILRHMNLAGGIQAGVVRVWLLLGGLGLLSAGCGVKAPPVPPDVRPPVIAKFTHTLVDGSLNLSWELAGSSPVPQSYTVYRSREPLAEAPCQGCPLIFKRMITIPSDGRADGTQTISIEPGYRYGMKMTATDDNGVEGPDSQTIKFTY